MPRIAQGASENDPAVDEGPNGQIPASLAKARVSQLGEWLRLAFATTVLPNLITFAAFASFAGFFRGWINIEFLLIVAAYALTRRRFFLLVLPLELLLDLFEPIAHVYYFQTSDALNALSYLSVVPPRTLAIYAACVLAYLAFVTTGVIISVKPIRQIPARVIAGAALFAVCGLFGCDYFSGRYQLLGSDMKEIHVNLVRTPAISAGYMVLKSYRRRGLGSGNPRVTPSAASHLLSVSQPSLLAARANFVVIILESWGQMEDAAVTRQMLSPYARTALQAVYDVHFGAVPFHGPTVAGETRELCGQTFQNGIAGASADDLRGCLPNLFASHGYSTIGIHGFYPRVYDRVHWYPRVGFQTSLFKPDLDRLGMRTCPGGLVGTCDADVADWMTARLKQSSPEHPVYIHWASINSHIPVVDVISQEQARACQAMSPVLQDRTLCNWYTLVERVHLMVTKMAMAARLPATAFVIVGDHAPPFSSSARRSLFSQKQVPYVLLTPKTMVQSGISAVQPAKTARHFR
jgi:hypothetical protein